MKEKGLEILEVVRVVDLGPIVPSSGDGSHESFKFRIEILHPSGSSVYEPRVYRHETYRIPATFPISSEGGGNEPCDEEVLVRDRAREWEKLKGSSPEEVLEAVLSEIREVFGLGDARTGGA